MNFFQFEKKAEIFVCLKSRGVTNMLAFWFGQSGYQETLKNINYES